VAVVHAIYGEPFHISLVLVGDGCEGTKEGRMLPPPISSQVGSQSTLVLSIFESIFDSHCLSHDPLPEQGSLMETNEEQPSSPHMDNRNFPHHMDHKRNCKNCFSSFLLPF
jgi:hypothetical protein